MNNKILCRYEQDFGRSGDLDGLFITTKETLDFFFTALNGYVYFGEALGKHSEVYGELEQDNIKILCEDQERVNWLQDLLGTSLSGYNPLDYCNIHTQEHDDVDLYDLMELYNKLCQEIDSRLLDLKTKTKYKNELKREMKDIYDDAIQDIEEFITNYIQ